MNITKLMPLVISIIISLSLFPALGIAASNQLISAKICDAQCQQHIQSMLDDYRVKHQILAMQMSVGLSNSSIVNFNSGTLTDPNKDPAAKKVTSNSLLKINSITKTFTAAIIFQLENEGKLSLTDTVGKWFPKEYPEWKNITIDQMLHMTSGIYEYGSDSNKSFWDEVNKDWSRIWTSPELIDFGYYDKEHSNSHPWCIMDYCPIKPGKGWDYSNTNYILLTQIIEKSSGESYKKNLDDRIINNSKIGFNKQAILYDPDNKKSNPESLENMVHLYYDSQDITSFPFSVERGAGGIISNTENLVKWLRALFNGEVLSQTSFNKMTSLVCQNNDGGVGDCISIDAQGGITKYRPGDAMPNDQLTNNGYSSGLSTAIYPDSKKGEFIWLSFGGFLGYEAQSIYFKNTGIIIAAMENKPSADIVNLIFEIKNYLLQQKSGDH